MSHSSVVGQVGHAVTHASDWTDPKKIPSNPLAWATPLVPLAAMGLNGAMKSDVPQMQNAAGSSPNTGAATQQALQTQLNQEVAQRGARTLFTSAGGLLDGPANSPTASRVLLGGS